MTSLHHLVLISVLVFAAAVLAGLAAAVVKGLEAWRAYRRFRRRTAAKLAETAALISRIEARAGSAAESAARLDRARTSLQESLATFAVVTGGAREAWSLVGRMRGVVPRK
jgi:hypothetical protein